MPRKQWISKNPYCRNSRLDKSSFEKIVDSYIHEAFSFSRYSSYLLFLALLHTEDRAEVKRILKELTSLSSSELTSRENVITQRSFNNYFERIGNHLWSAFVDPKSDFAQHQETAFDELLDLIYEKTDKVSDSIELFSFFGSSPLNIKQSNIASSLLFYLLYQRSKVVRGFAKEKFYLEFIRIFFICTVIEKIQVDLKSIYSITWPPQSYTENYPDDVEIVRIQSAAIAVLLGFLEECPM